MPARSMAEGVNAGMLREFCAWTTVSRCRFGLCRYGRRRAAQVRLAQVRLAQGGAN